MLAIIEMEKIEYHMLAVVGGNIGFRLSYLT